MEGHTRRRDPLLQANRFLELMIASLADQVKRNGWEAKVMGGDALNHLIYKIFSPTLHSSHSWCPLCRDILFRDGYYPDILDGVTYSNAMVGSRLKDRLTTLRDTSEGEFEKDLRDYMRRRGGLRDGVAGSIFSAFGHFDLTSKAATDLQK